MRGSDKDGLRRSPPVGRRKSRLSGVVKGMLCGVVLFGGMLVVLNEIAPKGGGTTGFPEVSSDDAKTDPDAPAISLSADDNNPSRDEAASIASGGEEGDSASTDTRATDENAKDATREDLAADNRASTGAVSEDKPANTPVVQIPKPSP